MKDDTLELLIDRVLSGQGDAPSHAELEARLRDDPAALDLYCRCCALHSALGRLGQGAVDPEVLDALRAKAARTVKYRRWRIFSTAAAAAVMLSAGLWLWMRPASAVIATIHTDAGTRVELTHGSRSRIGPDELTRGSRLRVLNGQATLDLPGVGSATLPPGSEVEIVSAHHVRMIGGTALWRVSSRSIPLDIETPDLRLSTREGDFSIEAGHAANDRVAVTSGEVVLHERSGPRAAETAVLGPASEYPRPKEGPVAGTLRPGGTQASGTTARWVRWSFEENPDGSWPSVGNGPVIPPLLPVSADTPRPIDGAFGTALRFEPGQFLRAPWPAVIQEHPITFTGWIRFQSPSDVPAEFASFFFMGDETATRPQLWWGIGIHPGAFKPQPGHSGPAPDPGKWTHFAGVMQGDERSGKIERVILYIDGREVTNLHLTSDLPPSHENNVVRIGNRSYGFDLDEWTVIERGLSPDEVTRLARRETWPLK